MSNHERHVQLFGLIALAAVLALAGCGRKGPPLPPLVKEPSAPGDMKAERHGTVVDVGFTVPATNSDGTRPANVSRIDVYALTAARALSEGEVLKHGTRIATLPVKAPRDPSLTSEPDEAGDVELQGTGLNQGVRAHVEERLTAEVLKPVDVPIAQKDPRARAAAPPPQTDGPLVPPVLPRPTRVYVSIPITTKGKNGPTAHAVVSMIETPPTPPAPTITYDEKTITLSWLPVQVGMSGGAPSEDVLPSRPIGISVPAVAYNVYEVTEDGPSALRRLTDAPVAEPRLTDSRMAWGERRCYAVRAFVTIEDVSLEGNESPPQCVTLTDTFPPAAPRGLQAVPSEGAISLIWDANSEADVRGYIVLRGPVGSQELEPIVTEPVQETSFQDHTQSGVRFAYAVQAVDNAGNLGPPSARVEETAR